jgi:hypothetical protein
VSNQCELFFYTEGIVRKEFVPPWQTVNGNLYCDVLKESVQLKRPLKGHKNS